ncbi:MAG: bifunctional copper resistance protein CopD/cytochrome c oxidase assembly protein [Rhodoluna sp.]|nr:bifunctional copper resistance protein CopD/cytochrome c oxidase assembly protein [Rhodoluna sp.]
MVRWGLPISRAVMDVAMATTIGALVIAAFVFAESSKQLRIAMNTAAAASVIWVISGLLALNFTYLNVTGTAFSFDQTQGSGFWLFVTQIELGQYQLLNLAGGVVVSILAISSQRLTSAALTAAVAFVALVPMALTGHASGTANHGMAVNSLGLHLLAISIWVGGLIALTVVRYRAGVSQVEVGRFSSLALFSFGLVFLSGLINAQLRIGTLENWMSEYGILVLLKMAALAVLGIIGAAYRRKLVASISSKPKAFWRIVGLELAIMAIAIGLAAGLSRTAPPVNPTELVGTTPAELLTGQKLPPELTLTTFFTQFKPDLLWLVVATAAIVGYLLGVRRLRLRGDKWPLGRTVSWVTGMLLLAFITSGSLNAYQEYLFSVHMVAHMLLTMAVPIFLVPGAPITLLSRAVEKRSDDSRGIREWALWAVHTKYARVISHPVIAAVMFAGSLVVFYFTPIFGWSTNEHIGHEWMVLHFLITGYLFVQSIIGVDPGPHKIQFPLRIMLLIGTLAFHAFFGLALMAGDGLLLPEWFGAMGRTWGPTPLEDQKIGGAIAWGIGELPTAALTIIVSVQWFRSDARDARRLDRAADRGGNKDLENYNAMLSKLADRDQGSN